MREKPKSILRNVNQTMARPAIFVSHSSRDTAVAEAFVNLLRAAFDFKPSQIRCTSVDGYGLSLGDDTERQLRQEVIHADIFFGIVSSLSTASAYVTFEMGARWGSDKLLFPVLVCAADSDLLKGGPLAGRHALRCDTDTQVEQILSATSRATRQPPNPRQAWAKDVQKLVEAAQLGRGQAFRVALADNLAAHAALAASRAVASVLASPTASLADGQKLMLPVGNLCRAMIHPAVTWVDAMVWLSAEEARDRPRRTLLGPTEQPITEWLKIVCSEVPRNEEPRLIPVSVNGIPWRGSGAAFVSQGITYVDRCVDRIGFYQYGLSPDEVSAVRDQYLTWEEEHSFAALVAIALPRGIEDRASSGVLNLNFARPYPFGHKDVLSPDESRQIEEVLEAQLLALSRLFHSP